MNLTKLNKVVEKKVKLAATANKPVYRIYVEGGLHEEVSDPNRAKKLAEKYRSEGWNVKVIKWVITVAGPMGTDSGL